MSQDWNGYRPRRFGRRHVLHSLLGGAAIISSQWAPRLVLADTAGGALPTPGSIQHFTIAGGGSADGTSWQHAMPTDKLASEIGSAKPGSAYLIGFDPHDPAPVTWNRPYLYLRSSGAPGKPIEVIAGYIDPGGKVAPSPADAPFLFQGLKDWTPQAAVSKNAPRGAIILDGDVSHVALSGFRIEGTGADGFVKFGNSNTAPGSFDDISISDFVVRNAGRVIETTKKTELKNVTIENCQLLGAVRGFARFWNISDSTLRNLTLDADHIDGGGTNVCQLIAVFSGSNVTFENVTLKNAANTAGRKYAQGDGIVCELGTSNFTIRRCHASGMGDGGFDVKTTDVTIEDSTAEDCHYGARIWSHSNNVIRRCAFKSRGSPTRSSAACIQVSGRAVVSETTLEVAPGSSAFHLPQLKNADPANVQMIGGSIHLAEGAQLVSGTAKGVLELKGVSVNGVTKDGRFTKDHQ